MWVLMNGEFGPFIGPSTVGVGPWIGGKTGVAVAVCFALLTSRITQSSGL